MPELSSRILSTPQSVIRKYDPLIREAQRKLGVKNVYQMQIGGPDIPVTLKGKTLHMRNFGYGPSLGLDELRKLVADKYGFSIDNVVITSGSSQGIEFAFNAVADSTRPLIVAPEPFYANALQIARAMGLDILPIPTSFENEFNFPPEKDVNEGIRRANGKANALYLENPSNPTGRLLTEQDLSMFSRIAAKHDLWVIVDSAYKELALPGSYISPFEISGMDDSVIELSTLSKGYNIAGARVGAIVSKAENFLDYVSRFSDMMLGPSVPSQRLAILAMQQTNEKVLAGVRDEYLKRYETETKELDRMRDLELEFHHPDVPYYIFFRIGRNQGQLVNLDELMELSLLSPEFYKHQMSTAAIAPGYGFYMQGNEVTKGINHGRIALVQPIERLKMGTGHLRAGIEFYLENAAGNSNIEKVCSR